MTAPEQFEVAFLAWMQNVFEATDGEVVAIDGKSCIVTIDAIGCQREIAGAIQTLIP